MVVFLHVLGGFPQNVMIRFASYFVLTSWIHIAAFQNFRHERISSSGFDIWGETPSRWERSAAVFTLPTGSPHDCTKENSTHSCQTLEFDVGDVDPRERPFISSQTTKGNRCFGCEKISTNCRSPGWSWDLACIPTTCENLLSAGFSSACYLCCWPCSFLVGVLACYAGKCVIDWASTTPRVTPVVTLSIDDLRLKTIPDGLELKRLEPSGS